MDPYRNGLKENAKKGKEKENSGLAGIHKSRNLKDIRNGSNTSLILFFLSFLSIKLRRLKVWETNGKKYSLIAC